MYRITNNNGTHTTTRSRNAAMQAADNDKLVEIKVSGEWRRSGLMPTEAEGVADQLLSIAGIFGEPVREAAPAPTATVAAYKAHCMTLSTSYTPTAAPITARSFDSFTPRQQRAMKRALRKAPVAVACLDCAAEYIPGPGDTALICAECVVVRLLALLPSDVDGYLAAVRALPEGQVAAVAACWPSAINYSPLVMWRMLRGVDAIAGF